MRKNIGGILILSIVEGLPYKETRIPAKGLFVLSSHFLSLTRVHKIVTQ